MITGKLVLCFKNSKGKKEVISWRAALNFISIDLTENQSYCLCNYHGMK